MFFRSFLLFFFTVLVLSGCQRSQNEFNASLTALQKDNSGFSSYFFYPGTLKMLNFSNDPEFNTLIKDVKKAKLIHWSASTDSVISDSLRLVMQQKIHSIAANLIQDKFVSLMQFRRDNMHVMLYLRKENQKPVELAGVFYDRTDIYILDLVGSISLKALPALFTRNIKMSGFETILSAIKPQSKITQPPRKHDRKNTGN